MLTLNLILKEIKEVPVDRLEELYKYVHTLTGKKKKATTKTENFTDDIFGCLSDISEEDYKDFVNHTKKVRKELFNRKFDI